MNRSRYDIGTFYADDEPCSKSLVIDLDYEDWQKFEKTPLYRELMDWLEESGLPCAAPSRTGPEPRVPVPVECHDRHPVLQLIVSVISKLRIRQTAAL